MSDYHVSVYVILSSVKATAVEVFDVEVECTLCGHRAWASVRGEGVGQSVGGPVATHADYAVARHYAGEFARADAIRKARGCPCPACGRHDPQTVEWAAHAEKRAERRRWWRLWFGPVTLPAIPVVAALFMAIGVVGDYVNGRENHADLTVFLFIMALAGMGWLLAVPIAFVTLAPRRDPAPRLYATPPPDVVFRPAAAYR